MSASFMAGQAAGPSRARRAGRACGGRRRSSLGGGLRPPFEHPPGTGGAGKARARSGTPIAGWFDCASYPDTALGHHPLDEGKQLAPCGGEAVLGDAALARSAAEGRRLVRVIQEMADGVTE